MCVGHLSIVLAEKEKCTYSVQCVHISMLFFFLYVPGLHGLHPTTQQQQSKILHDVMKMLGATRPLDDKDTQRRHGNNRSKRTCMGHYYGYGPRSRRVEEDYADPL